MRSQRSSTLPKGEPARPRRLTPARLLSRVVTFLLCLYAGLLVYPQPLFAHHVTYKNVTLYSPRPLPREATRAVLERAVALLSRSQIADERRTHRVFLCDDGGGDFRRFRFFRPLGGDAFAVNLFAVRNIFIASADVRSDEARRNGSTFNQRRLSSVIAHEVTHTRTRTHRGLQKSLLSPPPTWKEEGYCDFVAGDGSYPNAEGRARFLRGETDPSFAYAYFKGRLMMTYLLRAKGLTFDQIMDTPMDEAQVERETRAWLRRVDAAKQKTGRANE